MPRFIPGGIPERERENEYTAASHMSLPAKDGQLVDHVHVSWTRSKIQPKVVALMPSM